MQDEILVIGKKENSRGIPTTQTIRTITTSLIK
jgi:hypothetical protein